MYYYNSYGTYFTRAAGILGLLVLAVVLTALVVLLILPREKNGKLPAFFQFIYDLFTPESLVIEKLLQILNVFLSLLSVLIGLCLFFQGLFSNTFVLVSGLLLLLLGPILSRVFYELVLLVVMQVKATKDIQQRLRRLAPGQTAPLPTSEEKAEKEKQLRLRTAPGESPAAHCPACGTWYRGALGACPVCGRKKAD